MQIGTAASPLVTGGVAAASLPGAFLTTAGLAWIAAALLLFSGRDLLGREPRAA